MPAGHGTHDPDPTVEYWPGPHKTAVALLLPSGQAYPAEHDPVHELDTAPGTPYSPAGHWSVQLGLERPAADPYRPPEQLTHWEYPLRLNLPGAHNTAVEFVDPEGQKYPAVQFPEHAAEVSPGVAPYTPPGHRPEQPGSDRPALRPYLPATQLVQSPVPAREYLPAGHEEEFALMLPAGHTNPAAHTPLQFELVKPGVAPN